MKKRQPSVDHCWSDAGPSSDGPSHEDKKQKSSLMTTTFNIDIKSDVICATCGHESSRIEPSFGLSLDLERDFRSNLSLENDTSFRFRLSSLEKCLRRFTRLEFLSGSDALECQSCKMRSAFSKQLSLAKLPMVLSFHLKRFRHSAATKHSQKVSVHVCAACLAPFCLSRKDKERLTNSLLLPLLLVEEGGENWSSALCPMSPDRELPSLSVARAGRGAVRDKYDFAKAVPQQSILSRCIRRGRKAQPRPIQLSVRLVRRDHAFRAA